MTQTLTHNGDHVLEAKVRVLRDVASYPEAPRVVEARETHMSWVFLTDNYAYKLKKPVRYAFLDFSTLEKRRLDCEEEVRLNRRLAPDVYLGTVPLTIDEGGTLRLERPGRPVEWLVKMRRLTDADMLDRRIRRGNISNRELREVASRLALFYRACPPVDMDIAAYRQRFIDAIELNHRELSRREFELPAASVASAYATLHTFLTREGALLEERVTAGRIVEGHGDLRPEHICLAPDPVVIDCLEFSRALRTIDPADELAFLAMECACLGAPDAGELLATTCLAAIGDAPPPRLVTFYRLFRATMRARLAIWHVHELVRDDWPKWQQSARNYLALADRYARDLIVSG